MPRDGALTLSEHPHETVEVVCGPCGRRGSYAREELIARHGDIALPTLLGLLAANCPGRAAPAPRCAAHFPALVRRPPA